MLIYQQAPNTWNVQYAGNHTTWRIIASDGSDYDTLANLLAASKLPLKGSAIHDDPNVWCQYCDFRSENSNTDGSPFWLQFNTNTAPSDDTQAMFVSGGGQIYRIPNPFHNVWCQKTVGTDVVIASMGY